MIFAGQTVSNLKDRYSLHLKTREMSIWLVYTLYIPGIIPASGINHLYDNVGRISDI
jgi:hypothetical protein